MSLLHFPKTFEHTRKIKIQKSLMRVDSDCCFWCSRLYLLSQSVGKCSVEAGGSRKGTWCDVCKLLPEANLMFFVNT